MIHPVTIPGPPGIPLLGTTGSLLRLFRDPLGCMRALHRDHGPLAALRRDDPSLVCAFGPALNREILSNPDLFENDGELLTRAPEGSSLRRLLTVLATTNGEQHRSLRRTMQPLFTKRQLERYYDGLVDVTGSVLSTWRHRAELDASAAAAELTISIVFRCIFGLDARAQAASLVRTAVAFTRGMTSPATLLFPLEIPGSPHWRFMRTCRALEASLLAIIRERRRQREPGHDVLSLLVSLEDERGRPLPEEQLVGLVNELYIAGHETTAQTLAWTLLLLDLHPPVLEGVLDELYAVLHGRPPTLEQIPQLPRLGAVLKESMRVLAITPFLFFRKTSRPTQLGGHALPTGARIVVSPLMTHHLPEVWPEPRRFRPERWQHAAPSPYEYLPFSAGARMCLGNAFASMALPVVLAMILQRYRLELRPGATVSTKARATILGSKDGIPMLVHEPGARRVPRSIQLPPGNLDQLIDLF